jgi:hypothetical protein
MTNGGTVITSIINITIAGIMMAVPLWCMGLLLR